MGPKVTVYVESRKIPIGETLIEGLYPIKRGYAYPARRDTVFEVKRKMLYNYILPDDHRTLIEDVKRMSKKYGIEVKVIDVSKEDVIDKVARKLRGISTFPMVEAKHGARLTAPFSKSELEGFISGSIHSFE